MINISYFQIRSLPNDKKLTKDLVSNEEYPESLECLIKLNFDKMAEQQLFDQEVTRTGLYRQLASCKGLSLEPEDTPDGMKPEVTATLLVSSSGFCVVGITISASDDSLADWLAQQAAPAYIPETAKGNWSFEFGGTTISFKGGVRDALAILGLCIHDKLMGKNCTKSLIRYAACPASKDAIDLNIDAGDCDRPIKFSAKSTQEELLEQRELKTSQVVTFGYHCEAKHDFAVDGDPSQSLLLATIKQQRDEGTANVLAAEKFKPLFATDRELWLTTGLESIRFVEQFAYLNDKNKKYNFTTSASFIQYVAYRRGVLGILQRNAQQAASERKTITSAQLEYWNWLLGSATDDFSLGRNVDVLLACKQAAEQHGVDHFDLQHFEQQTRRSVESFTGRVDAKRANSAAFLSILFGVLASITLFELLEQRYAVSHFISIPVVAGILVIFIAVIFYSSRRLKPPRTKKLLGRR